MEDIKFPVGATIKMDGIRCFIHSGEPWTRQNKRIPNRAIRKVLSNEMLSGLDGELIIPCKTFHQIQSVVMSRLDPLPETLTYYVFDSFLLKQDYETRLGHLTACQGLLPPFIKILTPQICHSFGELNDFHRKWVDLGAEGTIIRGLKAPYKHGRSTLREQGMIKWVEWVTDKATCVGLNELQHNANPDTNYKDDLTGGMTLGSLVLKHPKFGYFNCGSGFDATTRLKLWLNPGLIMGKEVNFKYKPHGMKDKPREPIFIGVL